MRSKRDVWTLAVVGAVLGVALWATFWQSSGYEMRYGKLGDTARGVWVIFTQEGRMVWLPYVLAGVGFGFVAWIIGKTSLSNRRDREARAEQAASAPHPMD